MERILVAEKVTDCRIPPRSCSPPLWGRPMSAPAHPSSNPSSCAPIAIAVVGAGLRLPGGIRDLAALDGPCLPAPRRSGRSLPRAGMGMIGPRAPVGCSSTTSTGLMRRRLASRRARPASLTRSSGSCSRSARRPSTTRARRWPLGGQRDRCVHRHARGRLPAAARPNARPRSDRPVLRDRQGAVVRRRPAGALLRSSRTRADARECLLVLARRGPPRMRGAARR